MIIFKPSTIDLQQQILSLSMALNVHNNLDIVVDYNVPPAIVNVTLQSPGTFTITFQNAIDASSVDINDFTINGIVYTGTICFWRQYS